MSYPVPKLSPMIESETHSTDAALPDEDRIAFPETWKRLDRPYWRFTLVLILKLTNLIIRVGTKQLQSR